MLHERSFVDAPTRLLRLARYAARLGFAIEPHTAELAEAAVAQGALGTVSGARVGAELRLALAEPDPLAALAELDRLGVLRALHPRLRLEPALLRGALELLPAADGRPTCCCSPDSLSPPSAPTASPGRDRRAADGLGSSPTATAWPRARRGPKPGRRAACGHSPRSYARSRAGPAGGGAGGGSQRFGGRDRPPLAGGAAPRARTTGTALLPATWYPEIWGAGSMRRWIASSTRIDGGREAELKAALEA